MCFTKAKTRGRSHPGFSFVADAGLLLLVVKPLDDDVYYHTRQNRKKERKDILDVHSPPPSGGIRQRGLYHYTVMDAIKPPLG